MQEEFSQRSVTLLVQTGKMTGKVLLQAIQKYLNAQRQRQQLNARNKSLIPLHAAKNGVVQKSAPYNCFWKAGKIAKNPMPTYYPGWFVRALSLVLFASQG